MNYPIFHETANDQNLIDEFYSGLSNKYPELKPSIKDNEGLLHIDMGDFREVAESLCKKRKFKEIEDCFNWVNSLFCRSQSKLLNAFNVSFLEYFDYTGLSEEEFESIMPSELYRGYNEMIEYMNNLAKEYNKNQINGVTNQWGQTRLIIHN